jgi:hypothetical protein
MCGCNKKINGMSKKIRGFGSIGNAVSDLLPVLAGFAVGQIATKQLTFLSSNPGTGNMVKLAAGLFFAGSKGFVGGMAKGVALQGAAGLAMPVLESSGLGLLPPGVPARYIAGIPEPDQLKASQPVGF